LRHLDSDRRTNTASIPTTPSLSRRAVGSPVFGGMIAAALVGCTSSSSGCPSVPPDKPAIRKQAATPPDSRPVDEASLRFALAGIDDLVGEIRAAASRD
jgi:hypothetical protein